MKFHVALFAVSLTAAELPRSYVDTKWMAPLGPVVNVSPGGNLQAALDAAQPGTVIALQAGAVYTGSYTLPGKSGYVYLTTAGCPIRPGNRARPEDAPKMARIQTPNVSPVFSIAQTGSYWRIYCVEMTNSSATQDVTNLVHLQAPLAPATPDSMPHHIILDRVLIHGNPGNRVRRGVRFGGAHMAVIDSSIYDIRQHGFDTQTISDSQGSGPYKITNSFLEATTENVAFGGSNPYFAGIMPCDIEIRGNHLFKPLSWKTMPPDALGQKILVKNHLEFKAGCRALVEGNIMENNWVDAQAGYSILLTPVYWPRLNDVCLHDVIFRNNEIRNSPEAIQILGTGILNSGSRCRQRDNVFENNYFNLTQDHSSQRMIQLANTATDLKFVNNTFRGSALYVSSGVFVGSSPTQNIEFLNNILPWGNYGFFTTTPATTLDLLKAAIGPGETIDSRVRDNVFVGSKSYPVPPSNSFSPTYEVVGGWGADKAKIEAATKHALDGQVNATTLAPPTSLTTTVR